MEIEPYDVTRSYLNMAKGILEADIEIDQDMSAQSSKHENGARLATISCSYLYSYMALTAFVSVHLHEQWEFQDSEFRSAHSQYRSFEQLMRGEYRELKEGLKKLSEILGIPKIHEKDTLLWQEFCEVVKVYRDFFVHPTPESFGDIMDGVKSKELSFPLDVAIEIIGYFYDQNQQDRPDWLGSSSELKISNIRVTSVV